MNHRLTAGGSFMTENAPTFRTAYKCVDCGAESFYYSDAEKWRLKHIETHRLGRCGRCGHFRQRHDPTTESLREYLGTEQALCCNEALGMGDFCGCSGDDEMKIPQEGES